jgi:toxin HigB-1
MRIILRYGFVSLYDTFVIRSFKDSRCVTIIEGNAPKGLPADIVKTARRKLFMIDNAVELDDLRAPPGNRLHPLFEDRQGQHAIWINDQWRVCFRWKDGGADDVEIVDYHDKKGRR